MSQTSLSISLPKRLESEDHREDLKDNLRELASLRGWMLFLHRLEELAEQADRELRTGEISLLPLYQGRSQTYQKVLGLLRELEQEIERLPVETKTNDE